MELTKYEYGKTMRSGDYGNSTVDLIEYGLRDNGMAESYDIADRLIKMRQAAFDLAEELHTMGVAIPLEVLKLIDVTVDTTTTQHICIEK